MARRCDSGHVFDDHELAELTREVSARLDGVRDSTKLAGVLGRFLADLVEIPGPAAVGIIYRDEGYVRPLLDVCILWSSSAEGSDLFSDECADAVGERHAQLAAALEPNLDTLLDFVDPTASPTLSDFRAALEGWASQSKRGRVVLCRALPGFVPQSA